MTISTTAFETTDLNLAAFLLSQGHALARVAGAPGGRRVFLFGPEVQEIASSYYQGAVIPARAFANALRDLKALIRET